MQTKVKAWEEKIIIPTYEIGKSEKNPIFLEKRVYQGSSGVVYPYPVVEKIEDEKVDKEYNAVYIENEYVKIMVLPELGGRVQMAYDKIKQRHFIYYNQVIKPALVGLTGPWISGGIEFNWPQHHRPSTFLPVDYTIEKNEDGSVTVWVSEMEKMFHQKGMAGFTLRPGKAYLEIKGKLYNRTPLPQTFLWWANPAVAVNDEYQSVFPPDVNAVFDHGKRDVSKFPIATGTYYKMDYSAGIDISRYKNIPVPTSYMAITSDYNFVGGYENDTQAGVLHVANHHISPGKKQWTWGNGDFGKAWDRNLTDEDGPYIELMAGVYTDNQPDFSWLQPYEEKTFTQYFLPYRELGVVKNASQDFLLNLDLIKGKAIVKVFSTGIQNKVNIVLKGKDKVYFSETLDMSPHDIFTKEVPETTESFHELKLEIKDSGGKMLIKWEPEKPELKEIPDAAKAALPPEETLSTEQLYLTGLHLEQYRHATYSALDYYKEALRREPSNVRNNNAIGLWFLRRGKFAESEPYFRQAVKTLTERNPNPYDGEPLYNLGMALKMQDKLDEAYEMLYKSCWNAAWQDSGYFTLAQISVQKNNLDDALYEIDKSLIRNWHNHKGRHLKSAILRKLGMNSDALKLIQGSLELDKFNYGCLFEQYLLTHDAEVLLKMNRLMHGEIHNYESIALDYAAAGLFQEAVDLLDEGVMVCPTSPMTYYYKGWCLAKSAMGPESKKAYIKAAEHRPDFCFPNRLEAILALEEVQKLNPSDSKAPYYLGNLWYDKRQYTDAIECWEKSFAIDATFPTVCRNLSLAYFNKSNNTARAVTQLELAFELDKTDARILMELDQLYKRLCYPHKQRLELLEKYVDLVMQRDDLYLERVTLYNQIGEYEKAIELIDDRKFHPWEGGEGKVPAQYQIARVELAKRLLLQKEYEKAKVLLEQCLEYPYNLGEGKLFGAQENDFLYYLGCACEGMNNMEEAKKYWELAKEGITEPAAAIFYNDQKPDKIYYQGLALLKLGRKDEASSRFNKLIFYGEKHLFDAVKLDYFAVSLPDLLIWEDDLTYRNKIHCYYMMGLGYTGLGDAGKGKTFLDQAFDMDVNHQGVQAHL
jgi:tetratricopeptide (TPR) repeat protein